MSTVFVPYHHDLFRESAISFFRCGDLDMAWRATEEGIDAVGDNCFASDFWQLRFVRAQILSLRGQIRESLTYLDSLGSPPAEDVESIIGLAMHRGYLLAMLGHYVLAHATLSKAEALASTSELVELEGEVRVRQAMVACFERDVSRAQELYQRVVDSQVRKQDEYLYCVALAGVGKTFMARREYREALTWLEKSLEIAESQCFGLLRPAIMGEMGACYLGLEEHGRSLELHFAIDRLLSKSGARRSHTVNLSDIGNVYLQKGDYTTAISYYGRALAMAREIEFAACVENCNSGIRLAYAKVLESIDKSACTG
jgi:tetratricopeptide (TPR) repeat protein